MKAIFGRSSQAKQALAIEEVPEPHVGAHQVLIEVHASALNRADLLQRRGLYPPPPGESEILGLECAGYVRRVGREVTRYRVGDRVMALLGSGGYAEYVAVHEQLALPVPESLTLEQAAAVPEAFLTAYEALLRTAELSPGERVLIHAGASGVGSAAVQIAREVGGYVYATARGERKLGKLRELGVHRPIDYEQQDFAQIIQQETHGAGVDVIIDLVGSAYVEQHQAVLANGGRWIVVGLLGGASAKLDLGRLLTKRHTLRGIVMRSRSLPEKSAIVAGFLRDLWPWLNSERLAPQIDSVFPLAEAEAAHARMTENQNVGKILLKVR